MYTDQGGNKMATVIYNCKQCKVGKRVEYPIEQGKGYFFRMDSRGQLIPSSVWIDACGGGRPTIYGGDTEMGICSTCRKMMSCGTLKAHYRPEVKCSAICTGARGHTCDCSCGGKNHGVAA
jgi:hypothetical protein